MRFRLKNKYQVQIAVAVVSIIVTYFLLLYLPIPLNRYETHADQTTISSPKSIILYEDLNHDGNSEKIILNYQTENFESAVLVYYNEDELIDQWNFAEEWLPESIMITDYNGDGLKEIFVITKHKEDSLFIYGLEPTSKGKFILQREYLTSANSEGARSWQGWDIHPKIDAALDVDGDGTRDLLIGFSTGMALRPRRFYAWSVNKKTRVASSPATGALAGELIGLDLDFDGTMELLTTAASAPFNFSDKEMEKIKDDRCWVFFFNKHLQYARDPLPFGGPYTGMRAVPVLFGKTHRLMVNIRPRGVSENTDYQSLVTLAGHTIKSIPLPDDQKWEFFFDETTPDSLFLIYNIEGKVIRLSSTLDTLAIYQVAEEYLPFFIQGAFDLDNDGKRELLCSGSRLFISDPEFKYPVGFGQPGQLTDPLFSVKKSGGSRQTLSISTKSRHYLLGYHLNPYYGFRFVIQFALLGIVYLVLAGLFQSLNVIVFYGRFLSRFLGHVDRGVLLINRDGQIRRYNAGFTAILGGLKSLKTRSDYSRTFRDFPSIKHFIDRLFRTRQACEEDFIILVGERRIKGKLHGYPLDGLLGLPSGFCVELIDLSETLELDRERIMGKTIQRVSHEIKTPLSIILLVLKTIRYKLEEDRSSLEQVESDLQNIEGEVYRIRELTRNFSKFSRLERPNIQSVRLKKVIDKALQHFQNFLDDNVHIHLRLDDSIGIIQADGRQLELVFKILLENSIDALKGKGNITIHTKADTEHRMIRIDIIDDGPGIPDQIKDSIFEPYFTTKNAGTGMGLTIAQNIVVSHGGKLTTRSIRNHQTLIRVELPVMEHLGHD